MNRYPHFAMPFQFGINGSSPLTTEQDSMPEIEDCVTNVIRFKQGFREDLPDFGIPDETFAQQPTSLVAAITKAVKEWEPRAHVALRENPGSVYELMDRVNLTFNKG